jgi:hypothetical protein
LPEIPSNICAVAWVKSGSWCCNLGYMNCAGYSCFFLSHFFVACIPLPSMGWWGGGGEALMIVNGDGGGWLNSHVACSMCPVQSMVGCLFAVRGDAWLEPVVPQLKCHLNSSSMAAARVFLGRPPEWCFVQIFVILMTVFGSQFSWVPTLILVWFLCEEFTW